MKKELRRWPVRLLGLDMKLVLPALFSLMLFSSGMAYAAETSADASAMTPGVSVGASVPDTSTSASDTSASAPDASASTDASVAISGASVDSSATVSSAIASGVSADVSAGASGASAEAAASTAGSDTLTPQGVTAYDVWVGGVQVTDANKDDILAGTGNTGLATYNPTTSTLTLGDGPTAVSISGVADRYHGAAIESTGSLILDTKSTVTLTGASCATESVAGIYVGGDFSQVGQGVLTVTAGTGEDVSDPANFSAGIYAAGDIHLGIKSPRAPSNEVNATGGSGSPWSVGIWSGGVVEGYYYLEITADGADNPGGYSVGVRARSIDLHDERPVVNANGGAADTSAGVFLDASAAAGTTVIDLRDSDALTAKGGTATLASYGIHCANETDIIKVSSEADLKVAAGAADATNGASIGIFGQLVYDATRYEPYATVSSDIGATSEALAVSPAESGAYRWLTDTVTTWQYSGTNPFVYSGSEHLVTFTSPSFPVWVGETRVTIANMNDVLGDGTVTFTPAGDGKSLGTLSLHDAHVEGSIAAEGPIIIDLTGDSTVDTTEDYGTEVAGVYTERSYRDFSIKAYSITVTGTGSLAVTASSDDYAERVIAIRAGEEGYDDLTICDSARVTATASSLGAEAYGVRARDITLSGSAVLEGLTSEPEQPDGISAQVWGIECSNLSLADSSKVTGHGCNAFFESFGITVSKSVTVADDATLTATSGSATGRHNNGYSFGLSGDTWESDASFTVTGGTVDLESGDAAMSMATDLAPDLSGYASYRWKIAAADELTSSGTAAFAYSEARTYILIVPPASTPTPEPTPAPTPATPTPATPTPATSADGAPGTQPTILPATGYGVTMQLTVTALAVAGAGILIAGLVRRKERDR